MIIDYSALADSAAVIIALPLSLLIALPKELPMRVIKYVIENVAITIVFLSISVILGVLELWPAIIFFIVALAYLVGAIAWISMILHRTTELREY
jgi:hypothetical protein